MATVKTSWTILTCVSLLLISTGAIQPEAVPARAAPLRELDFGDINFLHTTDTHGWHAGHLLEPSFSADWGDYISFAEHLRQKLEAEGKDLLIIDTGDRIEGNGLYDSSDPRGAYTFPIFENQELDLLSVGNHELYKNSSAIDDFTKLVPLYGPNYLASNLDILDPDTGKQVPFASRYRTFTTKLQGLRILAFGFIFDFDRNGQVTIVQQVNDTVHEAWFKQAVASNEVDLIIVIGHVALRSYEFELVHEAIRRQQPDVPIQFFGGHYHVRDYRIFDNKAHALASGRFMETIGFQSISSLFSSTPKFTRTYIDNNLYSLHHHSDTNASTFDTERGLRTSKAIAKARTTLDLDEKFGCASKPYWLSRAPFPDDNSIFTLLSREVFPYLLQLNPDRQNVSRLMIANTGAIRFDIFAGPFTRDSTFIVSPFTSNVSFIKDVPYKYAKELLPILNTGDPAIAEMIGTNVFEEDFHLSLNDLAPPQQAERNLRGRLAKSAQHATAADVHDGYANPLDFYEQEAAYDDYLDTYIGPQPIESPIDFFDSEASDDDYLSKHIGPRNLQAPLSPDNDHDNNPLTPGYTTHDDLGSTGDDTFHSPIPYYDVPNAIETLLIVSSTSKSRDAPKERPKFDMLNPPTPCDDEVVDVVFNQFLLPYVVKILNTLSGVLDAQGKSESEDASERKVTRRVYTEEEVMNYVPGETFTTLLAKWVAENWGGNCEGAVLMDKDDVHAQEL